MTVDANKFEQLQKDVIKLEMEIINLKNISKDNKDSIKEVKNDIEEQIDELKSEINNKLDLINQLLKDNNKEINTSIKSLQDIVVEGRGAKKLLTIQVTVITIIASSIAYLYQFFK